MRLTTSLCLIFTLLLFSATSAWSADSIKGYCLAGTEHSHYPLSDKCSDAYELGDYATALREWESLAEQGNARAQFNLGQVYSRGQGVPQNYQTAHKWYSLAAEQGDAFAQSNLGLMYYNGQGVPQDYKTAVKWWSLAAEQGEAFAQNNLGLMYVLGYGVIQDDVYAHMWFNIATSRGDEDAAKNRDISERPLCCREVRSCRPLLIIVTSPLPQSVLSFSAAIT